ncbi:MAG: FtsX-like permease family protein [Candidatus Thorarchaeota archaeon]
MSQSSRRRKTVTIFCLVIANSIFTGLLIYMDSYSVSIWNYETSVGPASIILTSTNELPNASTIRTVEGVSKAANFKRAWANIFAQPPEYNNTHVQASDSIKKSTATLPAPEPSLNLSVRVATFEQDMLDQYPTIFNLTDGRWPEAPNEVAFSAWLIDYYLVDIGAAVNYRNTNEWIYHSLVVVGIYSRPEIDNRNQWYYYIGDMVALPEMLGQLEVFYYSYIDVNRAPVTPFSASPSLEQIAQTEERIRNLDPTYSINHVTNFGLDNVLAKGIQRYLDWMVVSRIDYIVKAQMSLFIAVILSALTIRFNISGQEEKKKLLFTRGASHRQVLFAAYREIISLSFISFLIAICLGIFVSRLGMSAIDFFGFQLNEIFTQPLLITIDSFVYMAIFTLLLPTFFTFLMQPSSIKKRIEESENRKIGMLITGVRRIRWDAVIVILSLAMIIGTWETGTNMNSIPLLSIVIYSLPLFLAIGVASLLSKGMKYSSEGFTRGFKKVSKIVATIGGRRIGKNAKSVGPTIFLIALTLSLTWNSATVASTLPYTALNHARFAIGGDISVRLDPRERVHWTELMTNISNSPEVAAVSFVGIYGLSLSSEIQDTTEFVALDPEEYKQVAYDEFGQKLEASSLGTTLDILSESPSGVIVTSDIAESYELAEGDSLRAFKGNGSSIVTIVFSIIEIVGALPDTMVTATGYHPPETGGPTIHVGEGKVWMNRDYADVILGENEENSMFLCTRLKDGSNGGSVSTTILDSYGDVILGFSSAKEYSDEFVSTTQYESDRSLDTLRALLVLSVIPGALVLYISSNLDERKDEEILLRVLGSDMHTIRSSRQIEILSLIGHTGLLLILCAPILLQNTLFILINTSTVALISYPQPLLPVIPWTTIVVLLLVLVIFSSLLMIGSAKVDHTENLVEDKNGIWEETSSMREEM